MKGLKFYEVLFTALIILLISNVAICQDDPYFQMPLYFEDAVGNKDTVVTGLVVGIIDHDTRPLTQYGEEKIETPFDSVFDVRIYFKGPSWDTASSYYSKKMILGSEGSPPRLYSEYCRIFIHSQYPPVTVSYDSSAVIENQLYGSFFTRDEFVYILPDRTHVEDFMCVGEKSSFEISFNDTMPFLESPLRKNVEVEGVDSLVNIPGTFFGYIYDDYCGLTNARNSYTINNLSLYPNPAQDWIRVSHDQLESQVNTTLSIYDISGRVHLKEPFDYDSLDRVDVSSLEAGSYFLVMRNRDRVYCGRFFKL